MKPTREELIQSLLEKQEKFFQGMHSQRFNAIKDRIKARRDLKNHLPFADLNLTRKQTIFLFIVAKSKNGISVKDLSKYFFVSSGAVTQLIDTLIEKNLVQREEDPYDRRALRIKLTDFAKAKFANFKKGYINSLTSVFDNLSDEELEEFVRLVDKLKMP